MRRVMGRNVDMLMRLDRTFTRTGVGGVEAPAGQRPNRVDGAALVDQQRTGDAFGGPGVLPQAPALVVALSHALAGCFHLLGRKVLLQVSSDVQNFGGRATDDLAATPGATLGAGKRRPRRLPCQSRLHALFDTDRCLLRDRDHLKGSAAASQDLCSLQSLLASRVPLQSLGGD